MAAPSLETLELTATGGFHAVDQHLPKLHTLKLGQSSITAAGLAILGDCFQCAWSLRHLDLSGCGGVRDDTAVLQVVRQCPELVELELRGLGCLTDATARQLIVILAARSREDESRCVWFGGKSYGAPPQFSSFHTRPSTRTEPSTHLPCVLTQCLFA